MYCPKCGQPQISDSARFCSRCGFLLTNVAELLASDGLPGAFDSRVDKAQMSPREKGVRQGTALILVSLVIGSVMALLSAFVFGHPEVFVSIPAGFFFMSGLARILYVYIFERDAPHRAESLQTARLGAATCYNGLPPTHSAAITGFGAQRVETAEMVSPPELAEHTTKLLDSK